MNVNKILFLSFCFVFFFLFSCQEDRGVIGLKEHDGKIPVKLSFQLQSNTNVNILRLEDDAPENSEIVHNLFVAAVAEDGKILHSMVYHFDPLTSEAEMKRWENEPQKIFSFNDSFYLNPGKYSFYAVANFKSNTDAVNASMNRLAPENVTESLLKGAKTKSDLINILAEMKAAENVPADLKEKVKSSTLMSGMLSDVNVNYEPTTVDDSNVFHIPTPIPLKKTYSKVGFIIKFNHETVESFEPTSWQVYNLPKQVALFPEGASILAEKLKSNPDEGNGHFYDMSKIADAESISVTYDDNDVNPETHEPYPFYKFAFYQYENVQNFKKEIKDDPDGLGNLYYYREKQDKNNVVSGKVENGEYVYAPKWGSYVVIKGYLRYIDETDNKKVKNAFVKYTIHLGYRDNKPNDYNCERNTYYTYNITINGVKSIIVESHDQTGTSENESGTEGEVYNYHSSVTLDSHYGVFLLKLSKADLFSNNGQGPIKTVPFMVNTPYEHFGKKDINWIKFLRLNDKQVQKAEAGIAESQGKTPEYVWLPVFPGRGGADLQSIEEVVKDIQANKDNSSYYHTDPSDGKQYVYYAAYVEEFVYQGEYPIGNETGKKDWQTYANKVDREMLIGLDDQISYDSQSKERNAAFVISQHSIRTVYDFKSLVVSGFEVMDETNGWAPVDIMTNSVRAGDGLSSKDFSKTSGLQGRYNAFQSCLVQWGFQDGLNTGFKELRWEDFIDQVTEGGTTYMKVELPGKYDYGVGGNIPVLKMPSKEGYRADLYCLARNRDSNGDGLISKDEIHWVLPSLNSIIDLKIGKSSLPLMARLYPSSDIMKKWTNYPLSDPVISLVYTSNTALMVGKDVDVQNILWSNEGVSVSGTGAYWGDDKQKNMRPTYITRCFRLLNAETVRPKGIVSAHRINNDTITISFSDGLETYLNHVALRNTNDVIKDYDEDVSANEYNSRPANRFEVCTTPQVYQNFNSCNSLNEADGLVPHGGKAIWRRPTAIELISITLVAQDVTHPDGSFDDQYMIVRPDDHNRYKKFVSNTYTLNSGGNFGYVQNSTGWFRGLWPGFTVSGIDESYVLCVRDLTSKEYYEKIKGKEKIPPGT